MSLMTVAPAATHRAATCACRVSTETTAPRAARSRSRSTRYKARINTETRDRRASRCVSIGRPKARLENHDSTTVIAIPAARAETKNNTGNIGVYQSGSSCRRSSNSFNLDL